MIKKFLLFINNFFQYTKLNTYRLYIDILYIVFVVILLNTFLYINLINYYFLFYLIIFVILSFSKYKGFLFRNSIYMIILFYLFLAGKSILSIIIYNNFWYFFIILISIFFSILATLFFSNNFLKFSYILFLLIVLQFNFNLFFEIRDRNLDYDIRSNLLHNDIKYENIIRLNSGNTIYLESNLVNNKSNGFMNLLSYNSTIPGPAFKINVNDVVNVNFRNNSGEDNGIYFQGFDNDLENINLSKNRETNSYNVYFEKAGIYIYYPMLKNKINNSLFGLFIVEDKSGYSDINYDIDNHHIFTFNSIDKNNKDFYLINGKTNHNIETKLGTISRFYFVNNFYDRKIRLKLENNKFKTIANNISEYKQKSILDDVIILPKQVVVADVMFENTGSYIFYDDENKIYLGNVEVEQNEDKIYMKDIKDDFNNISDDKMDLDYENISIYKKNYLNKNIIIEKSITSDPVFYDKDHKTKNKDIEITPYENQYVYMKIQNNMNNDYFLTTQGLKMVLLAKDGIKNDNIEWTNTLEIEANSILEIIVDYKYGFYNYMYILNTDNPYKSRFSFDWNKKI